MKKDLQQNLNSVFTMKKTIFLLLVFLMVSTSSFATTYYSRATGDWNSISTWSLTSGGAAASAFPTINDDVIIDKGFTVTITTNAECKTLSFTAGSFSNSLVLNSGIALTVSGAVTIPRASSNFMNTFNVDAGTATVGSLSFTSGGGTVRHQVLISTGTLNVAGNVTGSTGNTSGSIIFSDAGTLNLSGTIYSNLDGTLTTFAGSTVEYKGTSTQAVGGFTYRNLILSNSGAKTLANQTTVSNLVITSSTSGKVLSGSGSLRLNGSMSVDYTGSNTLGAVIDNAISLNANSTFTVNSSTLLLNGIVSGSSRSLIKNGLGTLQLSAANTYTGSTIINEGKLELGAADRIAASAFTFGGGTFSTGSTTGFGETIGSMNLTGGTSSAIALGTGVHSLKFTASNLITWGAATLTIKGWTGTAGVTGTAGKIFVGTSATGLTQSQLDKISFEGYCSSSMLLSTGELVPRGATTYNGTAWDNGAPTSGTPAIISGNLTIDANFNACSLRVTNNAVVTVNSGFNVSLYGAVTVDSGSTLTFNNNAGLLQSTDATNTGAIIVKRTTNPIIRLDYTLWSSPVANQGLFSFSPLTAISPSVRFYSYTTSANAYTPPTSAAISTEKFGTAKGYLIRLPYNHPTAPVAWTGTFTGVPNNGPQTIALTSDVDPTKRFNLIGNPYPSPISIAQFVTDNASNIESSLYFWRKTNGASNPSYCVLNTLTNTFASNGETYSLNPNGVIQTGQGFFVKAKAGATQVVFNNGQRIANTTNQFFKTTATATTDEAHRVWLNITGTGTEFSQTVVGYFTNATDAIDDFDTKSFSDGAIALSSTLESTDYAIQGRSMPFQATDVVPMKYKVTNAGTYTIAIDHVDGLFAGAAQTVYLKDNVLGTYNNLTAGSYVFASAAGTFANRFELVYQDMLSTTTNTFNANQVVVYKQDNQVVVNTGNTSMSSVVVYDIQGRVLVSKTNINATETKLNLDSTNQVLLLEITDIDGLKVTKKIVN